MGSKAKKKKNREGNLSSRKGTRWSRKEPSPEWFVGLETSAHLNMGREQIAGIGGFWYAQG